MGFLRSRRSFALPLKETVSKQTLTIKNFHENIHHPTSKKYKPFTSSHRARSSPRHNKKHENVPFKPRQINKKQFEQLKHNSIQQPILRRNITHRQQTVMTPIVEQTTNAKIVDRQIINKIVQNGQVRHSLWP